jgi:hypothetical protein
MSAQAFYVEIETYCYFKSGQVILTLRSPNQNDVKGELVSGKPVFCNYDSICKAKENPKCFLKSLKIETKRRAKP